MSAGAARSVRGPAPQGRGGENEEGFAYKGRCGPDAGNHREATEPGGGNLVRAAGVGHIEQVPPDGEPYERGRQDERHQERQPYGTHHRPRHASAHQPDLPQPPDLQSNPFLKGPGGVTQLHPRLTEGVGFVLPQP